MVPILINKDVFESSYNDLELTAWNHDYFFTNLTLFTDVEAKTPILWPPDVKSWLIGKDPDSGKDWRQKEKGTTEDEMVGWHHQRNRH